MSSSEQKCFRHQMAGTLKGQVHEGCKLTENQNMDWGHIETIKHTGTHRFFLIILIKGIGIREVILTNGCPGGETKCIVRVEECRGPADCGWGKPISESLLSVKIPCIFVPPENRFQYIWKMLIPDQQSLIIPNDSAILEVHRDTHPVAFECDTIEHDELIASVKYTVYTTAGKTIHLLIYLFSVKCSRCSILYDTYQLKI
uniref:Uncharacterized protein n=1 Tax=Laticauda laticaudata TaxID=8630 RepID=A0A8C5S6V8_LATLA